MMARAAEVGVLGFWALCLPLSAQDDRADAEARAAVERLAERMGAPDATDEDRVVAIKRAGRVVHRHVLEALTPHLVSGPVVVRIVTARTLTEFAKVPGVVKALADALVNEANRTDAALGARITILQSLGALKAADAIDLVNKAVEDANIWLAKAGADAAAKIRHKSSVEPLLRQLHRLEGNEGNRLVEAPLPDVVGDKLGPSKPMREDAARMIEQGESPPQKTEREVLREPLLAALRSITGMRFTTYGEWHRWWMSHRRHFRVPG